MRQTGRQRRDGEGSEDLRPQRVPHRALPAARGRASTRPTARLAIRRAGWGGVLTALGTVGYYVAYAYLAWRTLTGRVHHRRPHLPRRVVPPAAHAARGAADRLLADRGAGALPRRPVLVLRDRAGDPLAARIRARSRRRSRQGFTLRGRGLPLPGRRAVGGAAPELHAAARARCSRSWARTAPARRRS